MHRDEERCVAAALEEVRVLRPLLLHDELAVGVELLGNQRVERPVLPGAMAIHDDDLCCTRFLHTAHGSVDLFGVQLPALVVRDIAGGSVRLRPLDDPGDAFHVADDEDLHRRVTLIERLVSIRGDRTARGTGSMLRLRGKRPERQVRARHRRVRRHRLRVCALVRGRRCARRASLPPRARPGRSRRGGARRCADPQRRPDDRGRRDAAVRCRARRARARRRVCGRRRRLAGGGRPGVGADTRAVARNRRRS